ncbi:MAG: hypothetical protein WBW61_00605 [Rhodanobacteraceae bacterium]
MNAHPDAVAGRYAAYVDFGVTREIDTPGVTPYIDQLDPGVTCIDGSACN